MASKRYVTANFLVIVLVVVVGFVIKPGRKLVNFDAVQNFTVRTQRYGYLSEEHHIVTEDGYVLKVFRLRQRNCLDKMRSPPVILQHGLLLSSDCWLDAGLNSGLGYRLADQCFDLWIGNARGNYYSRGHVSLNPDKNPEFWKFSFDEMGMYDVPAVIDFVLKSTGSTELNYVGYSQGASTLFIACSERPGYCDKIKFFIGLAPAARQTYSASLFYRALTISFNTLRETLASVGVYEALNKGDFNQKFLETFCPINSYTTKICVGGLAILDSYHENSISNETSQIVFNHFPAGTSVQNMAKYGQLMKSERFMKFDFGRRKNLLVYGQETPPNYNLTAVTPPKILIYGLNDHLVDPKDINWLEDRLPNILESSSVDDPLWNHLDMVWSSSVAQKVFPKVLKYLLQFSDS